MQIILFNSYSIANYIRRVKGVSDVERSLRGDLTALEEHLLLTQEVVEIRGKVSRFQIGFTVTLPHF